MNIIGQEVKHKVFGSGIVSDISANRITVGFSAGGKSFIFPDAFRGYLLFEDKNIQKRILDMILSQEEDIKRQLQEEQAKLERMRKIQNFTVITNSQAVFDIAVGQTAEICTTYTVSTGHYLSGCNKGQPRIADRLKPNSVCLLTQRPSGKLESERQIIGAFMVKEDFFGEEIHDGVIEAHPTHRMLINAESALLFWHYFDDKKPPRWGNTAFKYCSTVAMSQILSDMIKTFEKTDQYESALAFYDYFCKINRVRSLLADTTKRNETDAEDENAV